MTLYRGRHIVALSKDDQGDWTKLPEGEAYIQYEIEELGSLQANYQFDPDDPTKPSSGDKNADKMFLLVRKIR